VRTPLLQFCCNHKPGQGRIVLNVQQVRLATDLAVLDIRLPTPGKFVDCGFVPLSATGALKTCVHQELKPTIRIRSVLASLNCSHHQ
jgi:hypothetical protein